MKILEILGFPEYHAQGYRCNVKVDFFRFSESEFSMKMLNEGKNISTHGRYTLALPKTSISFRPCRIAPTKQTSKNGENGKILIIRSFLNFINIWKGIAGYSIIPGRMFIYEIKA